MDKLTDPKVIDIAKEARWGSDTGRNHVSCTKSDRSLIALNCYEPGINDEMHCHPGSDHTFFVVQGECTMKFLKGGQARLTQHQGVHVPAGYFYQLNNTGKERLILYQVSSQPQPRPKKSKVVYGIDTSLKEHLLTGLKENTVD